MDPQIMNSPLVALPYAAIDFESAGAAPGETDLPVQVGIVRVNSLFGPEECFCSYLACDRPARWSASRLHGITSAQLKGAPSLLSLWPEFKRLLRGCVIVGHNPGTERRFLQVFPAHGFSPWLDTLALARHCIPHLRDFSLGSVCHTLGIEREVGHLVPEKTWHDALYDAAGTLEVLRCIVRSLQLEKRPLHTLHFAIKSAESA